MRTYRIVVPLSAMFIIIMYIVNNLIARILIILILIKYFPGNELQAFQKLA